MEAVSVSHAVAGTTYRPRVTKAGRLGRCELQAVIIGAIAGCQEPIATPDLADEINWPTEQINDAVALMARRGLIVCDRRRPNAHGGRPANCWALTVRGRALVERPRSAWSRLLLRACSDERRAKLAPDDDRVGAILAALQKRPGMRAMEVARATGESDAREASRRLRRMARRELVERRFDWYGQPRWYAVEGLP